MIFFKNVRILHTYYFYIPLSLHPEIETNEIFQTYLNWKMATKINTNVYEYIKSVIGSHYLH